MSSQPADAVEVFYSYSHLDEELREQLVKHLSNLERQKVITGWHDRKITAGTEWAGAIDHHLDSARVILLLVSSDFMASPYCNDIEVKRAMERHEAGEARVIPVILRPCDWEGAPFSKLQALPKNARPVTLWANLDEAFLDIVQGIRKAIRELSPPPVGGAMPPMLPRRPVIGFIQRHAVEGRRNLLDVLKEELAPEKNQLVALWGPGGAGKTTLAAEAVRSLSAVFPGRIVWCSSLSRADFTFSTLLDEIAAQLGEPDLRRLALERKEEQVRALVAAEPTLVVLDNLETIKDEEQARCLDFLAIHAQCPALITTRAAVKRDDVHNISLESMLPEEAREFLQLLIAHTRRPSKFASLDHDDLIRKTEANPFVMQWVVKQVELAIPLRDALNYLSQAEGDAANRVFDRSFNLPQLGEDGRAALLALSLFTPNASRAALAEVAGFGDDMLRLNKAVENLSSLWLVETNEDNERLFLRGLTRDFSQAYLRKDPRAPDFRQRFVAYFHNLAEAHAQPTPEDYDALEAEKDNLLYAIDVAFEMKAWRSVQRIAYIIINPESGMLFVRGHWDEAIQCGEQGQAAARKADNDPNMAQFAVNTATLRMYRGEYDGAEQAYQQALSFFTKLGNDRSVAVTLHQLGRLAQEQEKLEEARSFYEKSLGITKRLGDQRGVAATTSQLGNLHLSLGEFVESKAKYEESLSIRRQVGDMQGIASDLHGLGIVAQLQGDFEEARRLYNEGLEIKKRLGNELGIANTLHQLGVLAEIAQNKLEALRLYREALSILEKLGSPNAQIARENLERVEGESE